MLKKTQPAVRVSAVRVGLLLASLVMLPSFSIIRTLGAAETTKVAAPIGAEKAEARAAEEDRGIFAIDAWEEGAIGAVDKKVFLMALGAARCAVKSGATSNPKTLTVIDYSRPSTSSRLWVYDLGKRELIYEELVAHGQGSGENYATMFSNEADTHRTSIGLFVTEDTYVGRNGYSLRLNGLDRGFNDQARARAIVMHGAPYVSAAFVKAQGRLGRSWGCPALRDAVARDVIDTVKGGSLVFSYYPDKNWMESSKYLGDCAATD